MAKVELTIALYAKGILSLGQAGRPAEPVEREFLEEPAERKIERHYTEEELDHGLRLHRSV